MAEVLFVSGMNMGLSRMLEGLLRREAPQLTVTSAGTRIDDDDRGIDEDARRALADADARCDGDPLQLTPSLADRADVVIVLGDIDVSDSIAPDCDIERWTYEDPAANGIYGKQRYLMLLDAFMDRVREVARRYTNAV